MTPNIGKERRNQLTTFWGQSPIRLLHFTTAVRTTNADALQIPPTVHNGLGYEQASRTFIRLHISVVKTVAVWRVVSSTYPRLSMYRQENKPSRDTPYAKPPRTFLRQIAHSPPNICPTSYHGQHIPSKHHRISPLTAAARGSRKERVAEIQNASGLTPDIWPHLILFFKGRHLSSCPSA